MDTIINFGKYKGMTLHDIYLNDCNYFNFLKSTNKIPNIKEIENKIIEWYTNEAMDIVDYIIANRIPIYGVNVHSVGFEFRNNYISIEEISGGFRGLKIINPNNIFDSTNVRINEDNYRKLYNKLKLYWDSIGQPRQDRGLY